MKKKSLILLTFLLVLYIGPSIFAVSYSHTSIVAEPNMTKDFSIAEEWYDESWHYRREIIITTAGQDPVVGTNYQIRIPVNYSSHMQADFDDIRFTDNDTVTLLDHWRENYTESTSAVFWVEVTDNLDEGGHIYIYYGNAAVSNSSDGDATFLMYEDWTSESVRAEVWDIIVADGSLSYSSVDAKHGKVAKFDADAAGTYKITSDYDTASPIAVMFRSNIEEAGTDNGVRQGSGHDGAHGLAYVETLSTGEQFVVYDDDSNADIQAMTNAYCDTWVTFQITRDGTNARLYADTVLIETASFDPDLVTTNPATSIKIWDSEDDLYSDWVAVRKFVTDIEEEPVVDSWGDEENNLSWQIVGTAVFIFPVGWDPTFQFGYDAFFIFLGLIMIPASTMYMVRGGREELSTTKLFYGLILFVMGFALLVGGIMP